MARAALTGMGLADQVFAVPQADIALSRRGDGIDDFVLPICLALLDGKGRLSANSGDVKTENIESEENLCNIGIKALLSGSELALAGVAELADAQDSKS